jgi:hypothetical protein
MHPNPNNDKKPTTTPATPGANTAASNKPTPPTDGKPPENKVETKPEEKPGDKPDDKEGEGGDADKAANRSKFFIVVGKVHEFETIAKAEGFLNGPDGPKDFQVVRGHEVKSKQRVTLR